VGGLDFYVEVPSVLGPKIKSDIPSTVQNPTPVDLLNGTVFQNNFLGQVSSVDNTDYSRFHGIGISDLQNPPSLAAGTDSLVATVTFDTTGVAPGQYELKMFQTSFGDTAYFDPLGDELNPPMTVNNGFITVVPEPRSVLAVGALLVGFGLYYRRTRV
jgi:hypothetical protein